MPYLLIFCFCFFTYQILARDVTFFVASDPHYGYDQWENNEAGNKAAIDDMNTLPGQAHPFFLDGVPSPKGVVVTGDLTGNGSWSCWDGYWALWRRIDGFNQDYEVLGKGRLQFPVYEGYGNHDIHPNSNSAVLKGIQKRNKSRAHPIHVSENNLHYSWNFQDLHLIQLNLFPGGEGDSRNSLTFLKEDLEKEGGEHPILLFFHYDFLSHPALWFKEADRENFYKVIEAYPIAAIFVGHSNLLIQYDWKGIPVFNAPSVRDNKNYLVVRIQDQILTVAERKNGAWGSFWLTELGGR